MGFINLAFTRIFDLLYLPFLGLAPIWAMIVVSGVTGILMLWIFGKVSDQEAIRVMRDRIRGNLLAVRLFQHDIGVSFSCQGKIIRDSFIYLKYALIPLVIMIVPVLVIMIQMNLRFSVLPVKPGEVVYVNLKARSAEAVQQGITLEAPAQVTVLDRVRIPREAKVVWRLRAGEPGTYRLVFRVGDEAVEKSLMVGDRWGAVSAIRTGKNVLEVSLWPGEAPLGASSQLESIEVKYSELELPAMPYFGWPIHWIIYFFVISLVFGFALKDVLGVEI